MCIVLTRETQTTKKKPLMKKKTIFITALLAVAFSCEKEENHDMEKPGIDMSFADASPTTCEIAYRGENVHFKAIFTDNQELGNFNIEIHNNFDHHSHSTDDVECEPDPKKEAENPFIYNQSFSIPAGTIRHTATVEIKIPDSIDTGDYHFMIRLTDKAGWQQLKAVGIKIR